MRDSELLFAPRILRIPIEWILKCRYLKRYMQREAVGIAARVGVSPPSQRSRHGRTLLGEVDVVPTRARDLLSLQRVGMDRRAAQLTVCDLMIMIMEHLAITSGPGVGRTTDQLRTSSPPASPFYVSAGGFRRAGWCDTSPTSSAEEGWDVCTRRSFRLPRPSSGDQV